MQQIDGTWGTEQISYYISVSAFSHLEPEFFPIYSTFFGGILFEPRKRFLMETNRDQKVSLNIQLSDKLQGKAVA